MVVFLFILKLYFSLWEVHIFLYVCDSQYRFDVNGSNYSSSGKIYADSVVLCGNEVVFLATDGLYKFDGISCVKILDNLTPAFIGIDNQNCSAAYFENKYY